MGVKSKWMVFMLSFTIIVFAFLWYTGFFDGSKFVGTIESIEKDSAIVKIEEGEILKSGNRAGVDLSVAEDTTFQVGDKIKVGYGYVGESYPLYIETKSVKLIDLTKIK